MLRINLFYFVVSFSLGMLVVYLSTPPPEVIVKFPSPYNVGNVVYTDKADTCYKYTAKDVACPFDKSLIKPQPIQEDFKTCQHEQAAKKPGQQI
jgi:hypothetical protein